MTVLAPTSSPRQRRRPAPDATNGRFGRDVRGDRVSKVAEPKPDKLEDIRARIERGAYIVDAAKVADAIVERLLAGGSVCDPARR